MEDYKYNIQYLSIILPFLKYKFAAKVDNLIRLSPQGEVAVNHDFGETWGATKEEARLKMELKVNEWIKVQKENKIKPSSTED